MNKIINWVGGSFFRTIGRLLVYILLGFLLSIILSKYDITGLFNILDVHANTITTDGWFYNMNRIEGSRWYNWTSSSSATELTTSWGYKDIHLLTDNDTGDYTNTSFEYAYKDGINFGSNGVSIGVQSGVYTYHYRLYYATIYVASTRPLSRYSSSAFTIGSTYNSNMQYSAMTMANVDCSFFSDTYNNCYAVSGIVQSETSGYWLYARLTSTQSTNVAVVGYNIEYIGVLDQVTNTSIQNIVANSGFATATSVNQVQQSVNQVQQEIQGTQNAIDQQTQQQQQNHQETMDTITDDDTSEASDSASDFFSNFTTNQHGLTGIITAPLTAIQSLTSKTCSPLVLPLPFVNQNLTLPCMRPIYDQHFGGFMQIYDVITLGIISYWIMVRIFALVKDFKNPEHDEIEVVEL